MSKFNVVKKYRNAAVVSALLLPSLSFAQTGQSYAGITEAVDFTTAATAIVAIFGLVAVMKVAMAGGRKVLGAIR